MSCNFDGPSFSCPSFSVNPSISVPNLKCVCRYRVIWRWKYRDL